MRHTPFFPFLPFQSTTDLNSNFVSLFFFSHTYSNYTAIAFMIPAYTFTPIFKPSPWPSAIPTSLCCVQFIMSSSGSQRMVPGPGISAPIGNWLEMQILQLLPRSPGLETSLVGPNSFSSTRPQVRTSEPLMNVINQFTS